MRNGFIRKKGGNPSNPACSKYHADNHPKGSVCAFSHADFPEEKKD